MGPDHREPSWAALGWGLRSGQGHKGKRVALECGLSSLCSCGTDTVEGRPCLRQGCVPRDTPVRVAACGRASQWEMSNGDKASSRCRARLPMRGQVSPPPLTRQLSRSSWPAFRLRPPLPPPFSDRVHSHGNCETGKGRKSCRVAVDRVAQGTSARMIHSFIV